MDGTVNGPVGRSDLAPAIQSLHRRGGLHPDGTVGTVHELIAQLSGIHVGGTRHDPGLLRGAIAEINQAAPDVVVLAGDGTRLALVAVDSSKPDLDEGEIGREH